MKSTAPSLSTHTDILPLRVMKACGDVFKDYIARRACPCKLAFTVIVAQHMQLIYIHFFLDPAYCPGCTASCFYILYYILSSLY